jgi:hypothetical protein
MEKKSLVFATNIKSAPALPDVRIVNYLRHNFPQKKGLRSKPLFFNIKEQGWLDSRPLSLF